MSDKVYQPIKNFLIQHPEFIAWFNDVYEGEELEGVSEEALVEFFTDDWDDHDLHSDTQSLIVVHSWGGEGKGDDIGMILGLIPKDRLSAIKLLMKQPPSEGKAAALNGSIDMYSLDGYYDSYSGADYSSSCFTKTEAKTKVVVYYK